MERRYNILEAKCVRLLSIPYHTPLFRPAEGGAADVSEAPYIVNN